MSQIIGPGAVNVGSHQLSRVPSVCNQSRGLLHENHSAADAGDQKPNVCCATELRPLSFPKQSLLASQMAMSPRQLFLGEPFHAFTRLSSWIHRACIWEPSAPDNCPGEQVAASLELQVKTKSLVTNCPLETGGMVGARAWLRGRIERENSPKLPCLPALSLFSGSKKKKASKPLSFKVGIGKVIRGVSMPWRRCSGCAPGIPPAVPCSQAAAGR